MRNYFLESKEYNPWKNLAIEKHLADRVRPGDLLFYLWQNEKTVVIGRNQNALRECKAGLLEEEGGYLARRSTGGGAVYQDMGNLCFTFLASPERYDLERQMKVVQLACRKFGIETEFSGRNDIITKDGYKFSGNAFSVNKKCKIQHGTVMIDVDKEMLSRYLTPSQEKMKAKGVKSVESRVCNLKDLSADVTVEAMKKALVEAFAEEYGEYERIGLVEDADACTCAGSCGSGNMQLCSLATKEFREIYDLYASWDWRYGKSPECEVVHSKRFSWGEVQVHLKLKNLYIEECKVYSDALDVDLPEKLEKVLINQRFDMKNVETNDEKICEVIKWLAQE
ncbi:MAG: lipoate--protein ligase [Tyzzerella sp.]|nr:lipoate--protein ligase [Tyzzerella sp.]